MDAEEELFSILKRLADNHGWDLTKRDLGPCCCEYGDWYDSQGIMAPIHECPAEAPTLDDQIEEAITGIVSEHNDAIARRFAQDREEMFPDKDRRAYEARANKPERRF